MKGTKRILSWLLLVCMVLGMFPAVSLTASAIDSTATWTETAWNKIPNGATVIIANTNNIALPSTTTSANPLKVGITVSGSAGALKITPASGTLDNIAWTVNGSTTSAEGVQLLQYGSTTVNLRLSGTGSNTALRVATATTNNRFVMGAGGKLLQLVGVSRFVGEYVSGSDWRTYNSETAANYEDQSLKFYVLNSGSNPGGGNEGGDTPVTPDTPVTIPTVNDVYMLVTSTNELIAGETYVIAAADTNVAMSTTQNTNNRGEAAVTKDGNVLYFNSEVQEFTLGAGTAANTYSFLTAGGYIYSASSSSNNLKTDGDLTANASWNISIASSGVATITSVGDYTHNTLKYNSGSKVFSSYLSSSTMKNVSLYRKVYSLVTNVNQLKVGDNVVIAAKKDLFAMSGVQNTGNRPGIAITKAPETTGYALAFAKGANVEEFVLQAGAVSGSYAFQDTDTNTYLYAASSSANQLKSQSALDAKASWKISVTSDGTATVVSQGTYTHNTLKYNYNGGSPLFSAYLSSSTMDDVAIYRKAASAVKYTATFYVNNEVDQTIVTDGALTMPESASFSGWTFRGWTVDETSDLINGTTTAPSYVSGNITISGNISYYAVFELDGTYTTRPTVQESSDLLASIKIITGEGKVYFSRDNGATQFGQAATVKSEVARTDVSGITTLTIVIKPADGYRIACIEKSSKRLYAGKDYTYNAVLGAYTYTFEIDDDSSQNFFRVSFLPRISDGGYTATQITSWDGEGAYVITGLASDEDYTSNAHDANTTYLLYGDHDTALDDSYTAVGSKSSALQLSSIGVSLSNKAPYLMSGLGANHMMYFEKVTYNGETVYAIRFNSSVGTDHPHYIAAKNSGTHIYTVDSYADLANALWKVTYLGEGAVKIQNVGRPDQYLKFNSVTNNLQFRVYAENSEDFPILYKASKDAYKVTYSATTGGSVKVTNSAGEAVSNGSYQAKGTNITVTVAPSIGYELESVTVNGQAVSLTDGTYTYNGLNQDLNIVVKFKELPPATITVQYYLNNELNKTVSNVAAQTFYVLDATVLLTYNGKTYPASQFSFDRIVNGSDIYAAADAKVLVKQGDVVKAYYSTTEVDRTKTVTEITITEANNSQFGGIGEDRYTNDNEQDIHTNVKQAFHIDLHVKSSDMIKEQKSGGNTDIILVLDHSNSMYPPYSTNAAYIKTAVEEFTTIVFGKDGKNSGNNRIAMVQYDTEARAWNGSKTVNFKWKGADGEAKPDSSVSSYGLTYNGCFMDTADEVKTAFKECMYTHTDWQSMEGLTNTMGGFFMTNLVARTRPTSTERDLVIIMFTDGLPTCRYLTATRYVTWDNSGTRTSAWELRRALEEANNLKNSLKSYKKSEHIIYNIALLNDPDITSEDLQIIRSVLGGPWEKGKKEDNTYQSGTYYNYQWTYDLNYNSDNYSNLRTYITNKSKYFTKQTPYADKYTELTGTIQDDTLMKLYKDIAYQYVEAKYVTGTITDVIPADFVLTEASKKELISQGCTVVVNPDKTTTITKTVTANEQGDGFSYDLIYQGPGTGSVYTNEYAKFDYTNLQTETTNTAYFPKPTVATIPFTVNDRYFAQIGTQTPIYILNNDLFKELTEGGYEVLDYTITLTDEFGNPMTYNDAIEQSDYCFDAVLDPSSNVVMYYTESGGVGTFYYVVSATVKSADGETSVVASRATRVDVLVTELDKYAEEVTNQELPAGVSVVTDEHGNVRQLYLVTLTVNLFDIKNGKITDKIPADFEFLMFNKTNNLDCNFDEATNTVTVDGINITTDGIEVSYYVRYIGSGYGIRPTNEKATITYTPDGSSTSVTDEFAVPTAGLNPFTVNDVDISKAGEENTLDIWANDLFSDEALTEEGYTVTSAETYLTDEHGNRLTDEQIEDLGIEITINSDGSITYIAPDEEGTSQFYYVVEAEVTKVDGKNFADNNSTTLVSRPTLVTIYTVKDIYIIVDFGLETMKLDFIDYSGVQIDKNVLLSEHLTTGAFNTTQYGTLTKTADGKEISFTPGDLEKNPGSMVFDHTAAYACDLTLRASDYTNNKSKSLKINFNVIPANNIYFEEYFIDFDSAWTDSEANNASAIQSANEHHNLQIQGYDDIYVAQKQFSNGSQKEVTVSSTEREHTGYFTFAGNGFDIIGSTNDNSGVLVAEIFAADGTKVKNILVDTWLKGKSYEQIPVIQFRTDTYGVYRVKLRAFYNEIFDHKYNQSALSGEQDYKNSISKIRELLGLGANEVLEIQVLSENAIATKAVANASKGQYNAYVDAVRIYNPIGEMSDFETMAYATAGELNPKFINVNDKLLDENTETWTDATGKVNGVMYIAAPNDAGDTSTGTDDNIYYSGVYLSSSGVLRTKKVGSKTYLTDANDQFIRYNNYAVYIKPKTAGDNTVDSSMVDYYYADNTGKEYKMTTAQVRSLGLVYYDNRYESIGPENEIYLRNGDGVAFAVDKDISVQVSLKVPYGAGYVLLQAYDVVGKGWKDIANVTSRTEMYYRIDSDYIYNGVVILKCLVSDDTSTPENERLTTIMSICNIKVASGSAIATNDVKALSFDQMVQALYAFEKQEEHTEHVWSEWTVTTEPTCTEAGVETRTCECGETETQEIAALGHSFGDWTVTTEPTCTEDGEETRVCACGETETQKIAALGHSYEMSTIEPTCTEDGAVINTCSACGDVITLEVIPAEHNFYDWFLATPNSCTEDGLWTRECMICGYVEEHIAPKFDCCLAAFTDTPVDAWFHDAVEEMVSRGLMNGVSATEFAPNNTLNRAMVVTVLYREAGEPEAGKSTFTDIPDGEWYADAVAWAQENGVVNGVSETEFAPMNAVTREQIATILYRYSCAEAPDATALERFPDADKISDYARDAMAWAVSEGIFSGDDLGNLNPTNSATRAEFATILMRYILG